MANGIYTPVTLPHYSGGALAFGNGEVVLYRFHQRYWILSHIGAGLWPALSPGADHGISRLAADQFFE
eukprot:COSAG01_NODE_557_length_15478_cov_45.809623_9_plen_68_part_00